MLPQPLLHMSSNTCMCVAPMCSPGMLLYQLRSSGLASLSFFPSRSLSLSLSPPRPSSLRPSSRPLSSRSPRPLSSRSRSLRSRSREVERRRRDGVRLRLLLRLRLRRLVRAGRGWRACRSVHLLSCAQEHAED